MEFKAARKVLETEVRSVTEAMSSLDESFGKAIDMMLRCEGRVVVSGLGKSGLVGRKISATLASTGTPSFFLHPSEAIHGDLGMLRKGDVVLALSNSGETEELVNLVPFLKRIGVSVISMTGNGGSSLALNSDVRILVRVGEEGCPLDLAPMASTTVQIALGDAIAAELMERRDFRREDFAKYHPGGKLGKRFLKLKELMHTGDELPVVSPGTPMKDVIYVISSKKLGVAIITDRANFLKGIITDGDLRRMLEKYGGEILQRSAIECANTRPLALQEEALAVEALGVMEDKKVTSLAVTDPDGKVTGIIHLHDLWRLQLI
ncbi:MAG TPA: KpsF/GutQ family sugar-phosphate isomerase [Acidobacteriota bacterium]|nr:KpsF/GutQ family sugar-phosphate isomerase [Acidobacteriota bacterium]HQO19335.1 KpsF/GutQ family sugar-phosphate isomerase [Acidobacteriota bacterium]HQQ46484.1 KpsF/GutQ family sugar-phosphate isomerase [Acidobacteriota bacterium]